MNHLPIISKFIAGNNLQSAINISKKLESKNVKTIFDFSVESNKYINRNIDEIFNQIHKIDNGFIALKLSGLGIENDKNTINLIHQFYKENNRKLKPNKFLIDAENYSIQNKIYELSDYALENYNTPTKKYFYKTLQMYRNDVWGIFENDINKFMSQEKYALKLVRGAYMNTDKKYNIINDTKIITDNQYNNALTTFFRELNNYSNNELMIATHNNESYELSKEFINQKNKENIYFATLYGMADKICYDDTYNYNKTKYVPYGPFSEILPYLTRRLIENKNILQYIFK